MLFNYKYVTHEIEKFQQYSDFLFLKVWVKARGDFDSEKLARFPELKDIYEQLGNVDYSEDKKKGKSAKFFNSSIENIYKEFLKLGKSQRKELKRWYLINNNIHSLFMNSNKNLISYKTIDIKYPNLSKLLKSFYRKLYGSESPFNLVIFGDLDKIKKDHYKDFIIENFDGHEGICPFCGINSIKGNDHSKLEAYDHFIPKGAYPFNSINFKNLAPMCHECNSSYKLEKKLLLNLDPSTKQYVKRKAFYPYSKDKWNIDLKISINNLDINELKKEEIKISASCNKRDQELKAWNEVFGIDERYKAKLLAKKFGKNWYIKVVEGIHNARKKLNNEHLTITQWCDFLLSECEEDLIADCNFLKKPFLEECKSKQLFK